MTAQPTWTAELRETATALAAGHRNADLKSRADEIARGAKVGSTLSAMNVEFVTAMRSRFGGFRIADDAAEDARLEREFDAAWGRAWDKANAR
jgi:hypothetical protein